MKPLIPSLLLLLAASPALAQTGPAFPVQLQKELAARASDYTDVTLDKKMLSFASQFMDKSGQDQQTRQMLQNLKGIYVHTYTFAKPGAYTEADLEQIRSQFHGSEWVPMVRERSKNHSEDTDVYMKMVNGQNEGMFVLDAEPKELDFVYIAGHINPKDLQGLGGNFGIPKMPAAASGKGGKP
uniref:DUF4252 domain-containing protein n=1 Tax=Acidobacterium capsulatum TaxID=33075 RepID=A0A7V5CU47_9BACT